MTTFESGLEPEEARAVLADALALQVCKLPREAALANMERNRADLLLAAGYRRGRPAACQIMRERFRPLLLRVLRDPELLEDFWVDLWTRLPEFCGMASLRTWLYTVAGRWRIDRARQEERRARLEPLDDHDPADPSDFSQDLICRDFGRRLTACAARAFQALPGPQRALLRLRLVERLELAELRLRPEIYAPGEPPQPVYGLTRRVQRACQALKQATWEGMARDRYPAPQCERLLRDCEGVDPTLAAELSQVVGGRT